MEPTGRACEICSNSDMDAFVVASSICAMSFNMCSVCIAMGAEQSGMEDILGKYPTYNKDEDVYCNSQGNPVMIRTNDGHEFRTRSEFVAFHNEQRQLAT